MGDYDDCCDNCSCTWKEFCWFILCLVIIIVIVVIIVLVIAFAFVRQVNVTVDDASLSRLALVTAPATAFAYNLSLTLTARNPNWAMSMKNTKPLEAAYSFDGQKFDRVKLADEGAKHGTKKTVLYKLKSGSEAAFLTLGDAGVAEYRKQNATRTFEVEVVVTGEVKYTAHPSKCKIEATCPLKLPLVSPGQAPPAAVVFQKVKCKLAKGDKNC